MKKIIQSLLASPKNEKTVVVFWILLVLFAVQTLLRLGFSLQNLVEMGRQVGVWQWFRRMGSEALFFTAGAVIFAPMLWDLARNQFLREASVRRLRLVAMITAVELLWNAAFWIINDFNWRFILVEVIVLLAILARILFWFGVSCVVAKVVRIKEEQQLTV